MNKIRSAVHALVRGRRRDRHRRGGRPRRRLGRHLREREDGLLVGDLERRRRRRPPVRDQQLRARSSTSTPRACARRSSASASGSPPGSISSDFDLGRRRGRPRSSRLEGAAHRRLRRLPPDVEVRQAPADHRRQRPVRGRLRHRRRRRRRLPLPRPERPRRPRRRGLRRHRRAGRSSAASPARSTSTRATAGHATTCANVDYTTSDWLQVGGVEGAVYQWMGPDVDPLVGIDLVDAELPRPALLEARARHRACSRPGINITDSNSTAVGWIVVYNDVRTDVAGAASANATVTAASVRVEAQRDRVHPLDRRRQRRLVGRQLAQQRRHVARARLRDRHQRDPLERARRDRRVDRDDDAPATSSCTPRTCRRSTRRR